MPAFDMPLPTTVWSILGWVLVCLSAGLLIAAAGESLSARLARFWRDYLRWLGTVRDQFFIRTSADRIAQLLVIAGVAFGALWWFVAGSPLDGVVGTAMGLALPILVVRGLWRKRIKAIRESIQTALQLMASRWRNSADVGKSFEAIVEHLEGPLAQEAELVVRELHVGTPVPVALRGLEERVPIRPVQLTCVGIRQALPLGGNIAQVLEQIAAAVQESNRLEMFVDSKTTEGRTQAWIMGAMPFVSAYGLYKLDPSIIEPLLSTSTGNWVLGIAAVLDVVGLLLILKITNIKV